MLGVDHDKIIILSATFLIIPILGKHLCCTAVMLCVCYIERKNDVALYCIVLYSKHLFSIDTWITYPLMEEYPAVDCFGIIPGVGTDRTGGVDNLVACYGRRFCRWKQRECATKRERITLLLK